MFDGLSRCIELSYKKLETIIMELKWVIQRGHRNNAATGIEFKQYLSLVGNLRHASTGIPGGKLLFQPLNELLRGEPEFIRLHVNDALQALEAHAYGKHSTKRGR